MADFQAVESRIEAEMQRHQVPGLALAAVREGEVVYARGFGVSSVETGQPVTPDTLFRIGSITKALTATAVMRLVEAGKLDLDRPVKEYLPGLHFSDDQVSGQITLRRLLSHSAGLPTDHSPYGPRHQGALADYVRVQVPGYRFIAPPGKLYAYSNPGPRIAGYVAEVVAGRPYTELMQELVFDPLSMTRTTFDPTVAMTYPLAQSHALEEGKLRVEHRYADDAGGYPSGFAISTVLDLAQFARMQMAGGRLDGHQVLLAESVAEMQTAQVERLTTAAGGYGLGLALDRYRSQWRATHNGSISAFGSRMAFIPAAGSAVIVLANRAGGFWGEMEGIVDAVLDEILGMPSPQPAPETVEPNRAAWPPYTGSYLGDWVGLVTVCVDDGQLILDWNGSRIPMQAHRDGVYFGQRPGSGEIVTAGFVDEGGQPTHYVQINSSPAERFEPAPAVAARPETWAAYAGRYLGAEDLTFRVDGGRLLVYSVDEGREMPCVPLGPGRFACDVGVIEFTRAVDGSVAEVVFGRVYTLRRFAQREEREPGLVEGRNVGRGDILI